MRAISVTFGIAIIVIGFLIAVLGYVVGYGGAPVPQLQVAGVVMVLGGLVIALKGALTKTP
jgi:hypothetical protein